MSGPNGREFVVLCRRGWCLRAAKMIALPSFVLAQVCNRYLGNLNGQNRSIRCVLMIYSDQQLGADVHMHTNTINAMQIAMHSLTRVAKDCFLFAQDN
jgi:hypothetical protein